MTAMMRGAAALAVITLAACGNPNMSENRGYTKDPLENPSLIVRNERPSDVSRLGAPNRVVAEEIQLPEPAAGPAAAAQPRAAVELPAGVTEDMVAQGETVYGGAGNCFACHGPNGTGTPLAPALNEPSWIHVDGSFDSLVQIITAGVPNPQQHPAPMPARGGGTISDDQVRQVAAYVYAISRGP